MDLNLIPAGLLVMILLGLIGWSLGRIIIGTKFLNLGLDQLVYGLVLGLTLVPLTLFILSHYFGLAITSVSVRGVIIVLSVVAFWQLYRDRRHLWATLKKSGAARILETVVGIVLVVSIGCWLQFQDLHLSGPDASTYLAYSAGVITNGQITGQFYAWDRTVSAIQPVIYYYLVGLNLDLAVALMSISLYVAACLLTTSTALKFLPGKYRWWLPSLVVVATFPALLRLSGDIYANLHATIIMLLIFDLLQRSLVNLKDFKHFVLSIGILLGVIFNVHGIVSLSALLLLTPILVLTIYWYYQRYQHLNPRLFLALVLAVGLSLPQSYKAISFGYQSMIRPLLTALVTPTPVATGAGEPIANNPSTTIPFTQSRQTSLSFPVGLSNFYEFIGPIPLLLAVLGLVVTAVEFYKTSLVNKRRLVSFWWLTAGLLALTQQQLIGLNIVPGRFTLMLFFPITLLCLKAISILPKLSQLALLACLIAVNIVQVSATTLGAFATSIDPADYQLIRSLSQEYPDSVIITNTALFWVIGLNPTQPVIHISERSGCNLSSSSHFYGQLKPVLSEQLTSATTDAEVTTALKFYYESGSYVFVLDNIDECLNNIVSSGDKQILEQTNRLSVVRLEAR